MINGEKLIHPPLVNRVGKLTLCVGVGGQLSSGGAWEMKADLNQQMALPLPIISTRLTGYAIAVGLGLGEDSLFH